MSNTVLHPELRESLSAVQYCEGGQFRPTLVIGLGGSGVETARRVKRILHERYQVDNLIRFLFIDTDEAEFIQDGELAKVEPHERASISVRHPEQLVEELRHNPDLHPYFAQFWDKSIDMLLLRDATGAAGIRPAGRFAFHASFDNLFTNYLEPAIYHIMQVRERVQAMMKGVAQHIEITQSIPRIYVISSVCGGTGSGIFMDTAIVIRYIFERYGLDGEIVGIFYLPTVFRHEGGISPAMREVIEANGYASLMELEHLCNPKTFDGSDWEFVYRTIGTYTLRQPLFDEVFLIEGVNSNGNAISNKRYVFEMTARAIMLDIGSPLGAHARSARRNSLAVIETSPCLETGQPRLMNSLGVTHFAAPIEELTRYCAARAALEVLDRRAKNGTSNGIPNIEEKVANYVQANHLGHQEVNIQLVEYLVRSDQGVPITYDKLKDAAQLLQLAEQAGHSAWADKVAFVERKLKELFDDVDQKWIPSQETNLRERAETLFHKSLDNAGFLAEQILNASGHEHAKRFLDQLRVYLDELATSLRQTVQIETELAKQSQDDFDEACDKLKSAGAKLWEVWKQSHASQQQQIQGLHDHLRNYVIRRLRATAAVVALSTLQEMQVQNQLLQWAELVQNWEQHWQDTRRRLQKLTDTNGTRYYGYDLEWFVILAKDFPKFYEHIQPEVQLDEIDKAHLELRKSFKHEKAFGTLEKTTINADAEAHLMMSAAVEVLKPVLRKGANILELIQFQEGRYQNGIPLREYVDRKLQALFDACQPYWSTSLPPGEQRYENVLVASVPYASNGDADREMLDRYRQQVRAIAEERGYTRVEYREDGYPFALTLMTRTYGARAYYLRSTESMRTSYMRRMEDSTVRLRLHVDKRFCDRIPMLEPLNKEQNILWSWAVAYGYVALKGNTFHYGIQRWRDSLVPRYTSEWQISLQNQLPADWQQLLKADVVKDKDRLGNEWQVAKRRVLYDKNKVAELRRAQQHLLQRLGRAEVVRQLEEYQVNLVRWQNAGVSEEAREYLDEHQKYIELYLQTLRESEPSA